MKKLLMIVLSILILMSQAMAGHEASLKQAFDELSYSLQVEWDQQDPEFLTAKKEHFYTQLNALRAQGVTNDEMIRFALTQVKDKQAAVEAEVVFSLLSSQQIQEEEAYSRLLEIMDMSYNRGASWSGRTAVLIIVPTILVIAVVFMATCNVKKDARKDKGGVCGNTSHF